LNGLRYLSVVLLLALTALLLHTHGDAAAIPLRESLSQVPPNIEGWTSYDVPIDQETLAVLGPGDFLSRVYIHSGVTAPISLFIAFFPSQRTGFTIHSPQHCLPGAGWSFMSSKYVDLADVSGKRHRVGEYVISNGDARQFVIYWYFAHGRSVANEYMAKFYLVTDAIRTNRTDGSLIRIIAPIDPMTGDTAAQQRLEAFTRQLMPMLPRFIPN
jgi:EpsI family protein